MGDPFDKGGDDSNPAADLQAKLAEQLFRQTDPLRTSLIGRSEDFLAGGMDVRGTPAYAAVQEATARNFSQAKDNVIARTPAGGPLIEALTELEADRAATLSGAAGGLFGDEVNRATTLATGGAAQGMSGLGSAAAIQAQIAAANAQQQGDKFGALGTGLGLWAGGKD